MKIVIAPDSFKGSLTQVEAATIMKEGIERVNRSCQIILKPMADGGEGTLETLLAASTKNRSLSIKLTGPLGNKITTEIGIVNGDTAVIEVAAIAGLTLIPEHRRNPMNTTTYGIGEAILRALDEGIRKFVIGLGGSSTNDGGLGMLLALGATIKNEHGERSGIYGKDLLSVSSANLSTIDSRLSLCDIRIASDVDNPLCGKYGASTVFGPQKGATTEQINRLDEALERYSKILMKENSLSDSIAVSPGAGAAGGLGFAFMVIGAMIESGAELIGRTISLHKEIAGADLVITGEGKSDEQTLYGKAPGFVADLASKLAVPVILISGSISDNQKLDNHFDEIYSIMNRNLTLRQAMQDAKMLLLNKTSRIFQRWVNSQINKEEFFMVKAVHTEKAPAAIGPYSQAIQAGDFVFVSGQIGIDPKNGEVVDGIENQTKQVLENLKAILTEVGADFTQVVKFTIYLSSMDNFATVNDIYGSFLQEPYPARATVEVSRLPKDVLVEMDVVVYTK